MARPKKPTRPVQEWPKIRIRRNGTFMVDSGTPINGKRIQKVFPTIESAQTYAAALRITHANSGQNAFSLSDGQRDDARLALESLTAAGCTENLQKVVGYFLLHHRPPAGDITLAELRDKFLDNRRKAGLRDRSMIDLDARTKQFIAAIGGGMLVKDITEAQVEAYMNRPGISALNAKNDYGSARALFEFAMRPRDYRGRKTRRDAPVTGWIARNPVLAVQLPTVPDTEPSVLNAATARALLCAAYETRTLPDSERHPDRIGLLPEIVLGLFAGLRPSEIHRLKWSDIELAKTRGTVNIRQSKNRAGIRNISLSANAVAWLRLCPRQDGTVHSAKNFRRRWERLKSRAGFSKWDQDCLRHTYASVHYRLKQDAGRTRAALGHSTSETGTLFSHYRALMTEAEARRISSLTPSEVIEARANIITMPGRVPRKASRAPKEKAAPKARKASF
jgi:integrase